MSRLQTDRGKAAKVANAAKFATSGFGDLTRRFARPGVAPTAGPLNRERR
jgi:hypothetical protein